RWAIAKPMPRLAPATRAVLPANEKISLTVLGYYGGINREGQEVAGKDASGSDPDRERIGANVMRVDQISVALASAATTTAAAAVPAAATASRTTFRLRTRFIDRKRSAVQLLTVEGSNSAFALLIVWHFNECKALGATGIPIGYDTRTVNGAVGFKHG